MTLRVTQLALAALAFTFSMGLPVESLIPSTDSAISEMHAALHDSSAVADEESSGSEDSGGEEGGGGDEGGSEDSD